MSSPNSTKARASRSCGNCRAVKRRCDKQSPQCGQCIRTHEKCQGYRDEWDLVFRDQTTHTIKRSKKKSASPPSSRNGSPPHQKPLPHPTTGPNPTLDQIGVNYFFQDFVVGGRAPTRGYLNYIPTAYSADSEHPTLIASMAAVGLVALATQRPELAPHARSKYSEAIRQVNEAIASPTESIKDSTLMSVISLGVFEHVSNFESWVRHVKGAAALVIARGKSQFSRKLSILMFNQVRADMCAACIQSVQPFPDDMRELQEEATKYTNPDDEIWTLGILATRCTTLFAGIVGKNQGLPLPVSWNDFVKEAIDLQDCFQAVFDQLAILEPYVTIQEPVTPVSSRLRSGFVAYKGRYDIYRTSWAIRLWNNSRMIEIIVCEMVCWLINKVLTIDADTAAGAASGGIAGGVAGGVTPVTLPALPSHGIDRAKLKARMQYTADLISLRGEEILMSIPQGLGLVYIPGSEEPGNQYSGVNVSGGYMLTWHLYTVGKSPVITAEDRKWVIDRLKGVRDSAGIDMAWQLAEDLVKIEHGIMYQVSRG